MSDNFVLPLPAGPSWNVPRISLPSGLGLLLQYEVEWWYYAGHAYDADGTEYTLQFSIDRDWQFLFCASGIGWGDQYLFNIGYGIGATADPLLPAAFKLPAVTDDRYEGSFDSLLSPIRMRFSRTGGAASGTTGSQYTLSSSMTGEKSYDIELQLVDERGMVMEWQSGYIGPSAKNSFDASSYEFAQPRLRITGGSLTVGGSQRAIASGMLWLDRQVLTYPQKAAARASTGDALKDGIASVGSRSSLYRGDWMGITFDDGLTMVCSCFWQEPQPPLLQWQTGTLLGRPPLATYGNLYFRDEGDRMTNGGAFAHGYDEGDPDPNDYDFDVNILTPDAPQTSPHWTSPTSGQTYANAWWIRIGPRLQRHGVPPNLYLQAVVPGCENLVPGSAFWEGAANVYADEAMTQRIGHAFVEQMGFN